MQQIKPADLKKIAQRFTEKYYPQWVSRVDRIWDMLEKTNLNSILSGSAESGYQQGNALGMSGDIDPQFQEYMGGMSLYAYVKQNTNDRSWISEEDIATVMNRAPESIKLPDAIQQNLDNAIHEAFSYIAGERVNQDSGREVNESEPHNRIEKEKGYAKVWTKDSNPEGEIVGKQRFSKLYEDRSQYEIFILDNGEYNLGSIGKVYLNKELIIKNSAAGGRGQVKEIPKGFITPFEYRLLFYTLKNNYFAGGIMDIAKECFNAEEEKVKELLELLNTDKDEFRSQTSKYRKTISNLNRLLDYKISAKIRSYRSSSYSMTRKPSFCLIETI